MRAELIIQEKFRFQTRYIVEYTIWSITDSKRYPHGVKYRIVCYDEKTESRVLMDNHHSKGDHVHLGDQQLDYSFVSIERLRKDFEAFVFEHMEIRL